MLKRTAGAVAASLLALFGVTGIGSGPAAAQAPESAPAAETGMPVVRVDAPAGSISPAEALATEAASYADKYGISVAAAKRALTTQDEVGDVLAGFARSYPDSYAGGWVEHTPRIHAVARFVGAVPEGAAATAARSGDVLVRGGADSTLADLQRRAGAVHRDVRAQGRPDVTTSYDVKTGRVELTIETSRSEQAASRAELRVGLPASARADDVAVAFVDGAISGLEHTRGGARTPGDSGGLCTTAFSVARNGVYGFVTAGHCANARDYQEPGSGGARYDAPYQAGHRGSWGDYQWHTTSHVEYAQFYTSNTGYRNVTGYDGSISQGDYICKYGRTTGYGCSNVYRVNVTNSFDGYDHGRQIAMEDHITEGGDSGGPWFLVNDATGVHSGWKTIWFNKRSTFSPVFYMDDALGLALLVTS